MSDEPRQPKTRAEWQEAADAAEALITLDSARQYGLVTGGPGVNIDRCLAILRAARRKGIRPAKDCVERLVAELNG